MTRFLSVLPGTAAHARVRCFLSDNGIPAIATPIDAQIRFTAGEIIVEQFRLEPDGRSKIITNAGPVRYEAHFPLAAPPGAYDLPLEES